VSTYFDSKTSTKTSTDGDFEIGQEPIPEVTRLLAYIESAKHVFRPEWDEDDYINLMWRVHAPDEFKKRVVFQKLRINDPKKKDRAWQMLAAIDHNCGGEIAKLPADTELNDATLQAALISKPMMIEVSVWEINDRKGNWVRAVSNRGSYEGEQPKSEPPKVESFEDDEIPF